MSDKRYKTIGQVGRELDDLVLLVERLNQRIAELEQRVTELEAAANVRP
jgi:uncharacterized small protein (DUF1192 family)